MLQWLVDLGQMAVQVRSSSFPRMQSTSEVARRCRGRNRLLARSCSPSYFQMEVQGCACDEAATFSRTLILVALRRDISGQSPCLLSTAAMSKSNVETKGATQKHSAKKIQPDSSQWVSIPHGQGSARRWRWSGLPQTRLAPGLPTETVSVPPGAHFDLLKLQWKSLL